MGEKVYLGDCEEPGATWQWGENDMIKTVEEPTHCLSKKVGQSGQNTGQSVIIDECNEDDFQKVTTLNEKYQRIKFGNQGVE